MVESLTSSELKAILHSKRSNIYYLQYCRILVKGGRVEYVTEEGKQSLYRIIGLPHGLSIMHGKTRRGGLVFDVADIIKDALVLPQAFIAAMKGEDEQEFRQCCMSNFQLADALDVMIDSLQDIAQQLSQVNK